MRQGVEIQPLYDIILRSMNENPLTHNPMKQDGAAGRQKSLLITGAIVLAAVTIAAVSYSVYTWQQNRQLSADVTTKNNQIAELQKQTAPAKTTPSTTPNQPADPYAGWQSATLKYEKASFKYPSNWTVSTGNAPGGSGTTTGTDYAKLVSPTGLNIRINAGMIRTDAGGPYSGTLLSTIPIATLGGSYYLGFDAKAQPSASAATALTTAGVGVTQDNKSSWPESKNIVSTSGAPVFDFISLAYFDAAGNVVPKPISVYQSDSSYNDALLIIKSLSY